MAVTCERFTFPSVTGQPLDARLWLPEGAPVAVVQLVHGMAEHIDRYDRPARALCAAGFAVVGHTHLGHGPAAPVKGYFGDHGWDNLIADVHTLRGLTAERFPGVPYVILGHSMGSFITRCYLTEHGEGLAAAVISGTGHYAPAMVAVALGLSSIICAFGGEKKPSRLINAIGFASANHSFEPARTPHDWLSRDPAAVDAYEADTTCGFLFTGSGYRELFRGLRRLCDLQALRRMPKDLPVLFFSGERDPIGENGAGVRRVAQEFRDAGMTDVTVKLYPEGRHEMFNELNHEEAEGDLIAWLTDRLKR